MPDIPDDVTLPGTPTHRARPSVITNASAWAESTLSYGSSIISADGFARLSQFPPPPSTFLPMPFAGQASPVVAADMPDSPARRALPLPPQSQVASTAPLNIQKRSAGQPVPSVAQVLSSQAGPSTGVPLTATSNASSDPSPYDWHDGSSSIATDPYGEATLPTHFITSLISSVTDKDGATANPPPVSMYNRGLYEPSMVSNAMSMDSTITYPPLPPPPPRYSVVASDPSSPQDSIPTTDLFEPSPRHNFRPLPVPNLGRRSPETVQTYTSIDQLSSASGRDTNASRAMSGSPSFQSLNSTTPLMRTFPRGETIAEEDEARRSLATSTPGKSSRDTRHRRSSTTYSTKTTRSYVSSLVARISHSTGGPDRRSLKQVASNLRRKPLPPVPPLPNGNVRDIMRAESELPLPDLVTRAQALSRLLDKGHRPHSLVQSAGEPKPRFGAGPADGLGEEVIYGGTHPALGPVRRKGRADVAEGVEGAPDAHDRRRICGCLGALSRRQRLWLCIVLGVVLVGIIVGVAAGVTTHHKNSQHTCHGNFTGTLCDLDATCKLVQQSDGSSIPLAESLFNLVPNVNQLYGESFTASSIAQAVWNAQGSPTGSNCAAQANLIDVAPLDPQTSLTRTTWAQTALLWNLVLSQDATATATLQSFIRGRPWSSLKPVDGIADDPDGTFSTTVSGWQFDFAQQTITPPPQTFENVGQPTQAQLDAVDTTAGNVLNRMYTYALGMFTDLVCDPPLIYFIPASNTQQQHALSRYWTSVLQRSPGDLTNFVSNVRGSRILLPFDSTLSLGNLHVADLLGNSSTAPFPPPLACYPGLQPAQMNLLNSMETTVFNLSEASTATSFDTSCYPGRPIYGVLDILHLRLPFTNPNGVAQQAAVLNADVSSRAVVYNGSVLSPLPTANANGSVVPDPRQYGTMNNLNHVLLQYLTSITDMGVVHALVDYVLENTAVPPDADSSSALFAAIPTLPTIEVAVFGSVTPSDIDFAVSSLSAPNGSLYFGTSESLSLRQWATTTLNQEVKWAEFANASLIVPETPATDANPSFDAIWNASYTFFHSHNNAIVTVSNITQSFSDTNLLAPN
ncbi:hypothetical protein EIP86_011280 [Pleurotus ostreatoroseus]|nr:hypothetical protein EIP86_011280 [Pleurotus ostreatoroseus]